MAGTARHDMSSATPMAKTSEPETGHNEARNSRGSGSAECTLRRKAQAEPPPPQLAARACSSVRPPTKSAASTESGASSCRLLERGAPSAPSCSEKRRPPPSASTRTAVTSSRQKEDRCGSNEKVRRSSPNCSRTRRRGAAPDHEAPGLSSSAKSAPRRRTAVRRCTSNTSVSSAVLRDAAATASPETRSGRGSSGDGATAAAGVKDAAGDTAADATAVAAALAAAAVTATAAGLAATLEGSGTTKGEPREKPAEKGGDITDGAEKGRRNSADDGASLPRGCASSTTRRSGGAAPGGSERGANAGACSVGIWARGVCAADDGGSALPSRSGRISNSRSASCCRRSGSVDSGRGSSCARPTSCSSSA